MSRFPSRATVPNILATLSLVVVFGFTPISIYRDIALAAGIISCTSSNASIAGNLTASGELAGSTIREGGQLLTDRYQEDISPNACGPNQFATQIADTGALTCSTVSWSQLASFPAACGVGTFVQGVGPGGLTCVSPSFAETDPKVESWAKSVVADCSASEKITKAFGSLVCAPDLGITSETDPTVAASVKDGVSWSELSGIPAGFADNVDNVTGTLNCTIRSAPQTVSCLAGEVMTGGSCLGLDVCGGNDSSGYGASMSGNTITCLDLPCTNETAYAVCCTF